MLMSKEWIICIIVFFDNKNVWFGKKNQVSNPIIKKVMIILLILWRPFLIFLRKIIL